MGLEGAHGEASMAEPFCLWGHVARSLVTLSWWVNGCKISFVILGFLLTLCLSFDFVDLLSKIL